MSLNRPSNMTCSATILGNTSWSLSVIERCIVPNNNTAAELEVYSSFSALIPFGLKSEQEDPLNLSISISGGKETNKDSPSNGE